MKFTTITQIIAKLGAMKFFPSDPDARIAIAEAVADMARDEDEVRWLVKRMLALYNEWPGLHEMRGCFCSRFRPKDGIEAYSGVYVDGIPSEYEEKNLALSGGQQRYLPSRETPEDLTQAQSLRDFIRDAARAKDMNRVGQAKQKIREIPALPPGVKPITQADIDRAVDQFRDARGREEMGAK